MRIVNRTLFWLALVCGVWAMAPSGHVRAQFGRYGLGTENPDEAKPMTKKQKRIKKLLWEAEYEWREEKNRDGAIKLLERAMRMDRKRADVVTVLVSAHLHQGDVKRAERTLSSFIKRTKRRDMRLRLMLTQILRIQGKFTQALEELTRIDRDKPGQEHVLRALFSVRNTIYQKDPTEKNKRALLAAADVYLQTSSRKAGTWYSAVEKRRLELIGDKAGFFLLEGKEAFNMSFVTSGQFNSIEAHMAKAKTAFESCLKVKPGYQMCHFWLGRVHSSVKSGKAYDLNLALRSYGRAPEVSDAHVEMARIHRESDDEEKALAALYRAVKLDERNPRAYVQLGLLLKLQGKDRASIQAFEKAIKLNVYGSTGGEALKELAKLKPSHPLVVKAGVNGTLSPDVFSSDRFSDAVEAFEKMYGGAEEGAPEVKVLERIVRRLATHADMDTTQPLRVRLLKTKSENAFATPDGGIYMCRGMLDLLLKRFPGTKIDENHGPLAHILAHEIAHVSRQHSMKTQLFVAAFKESGNPVDPRLLVHVSRLQEIEADRVGIVTASLAGYDPYDGVRLLSAIGEGREIPKNMGHPTFDERIEYLRNYWSNDVRHAHASFQFGVRAMARAKRFERSDPKKAAECYRIAEKHFLRFRRTLGPSKRVLNNLGAVNVKLAVLELGASSKTPLTFWKTALSVERETAVKFRGILKSRKKRGAGVQKPQTLVRAMRVLREALSKDPGYGAARRNLVAAHLSVGEYGHASTHLDALKGRPTGAVLLFRGVIAAETGKMGAARMTFERALKNRWVSNDARFNLGQLAMRTGNRRQAKTHYETYLSRAKKGDPWIAVAKKRLSSLK